MHSKERKTSDGYDWGKIIVLTIAFIISGLIMAVVVAALVKLLLLIVSMY